MPVNYRPYTVPLSSGLATKADKRALPAPGLAVAKDVEFEDVGGVQTRRPYEEMSTEIVGGGSVADLRKIVTYDGERLLFTKEALYSWSDSDSQWALRGTHLAAKITERSMFVNVADQVNCDRAELDGVALYVWTERGPSTAEHISYLAGVDVETGAVVCTPTSLGTNALRPRLVTMTTRIHLYYFDAGLEEVHVKSIDPSGISTTLAVASTKVLTTGSAVNHYYDVTANSAGSVAYVAARLDVAADPLYAVARVTEALSVTSANKARTCSGPIAVAIDPATAALAIVRANSTNIQGDILNPSTLADVDVGNAVGTTAGSTVNQIAAAYRSVQNSGVYRCYCFWSSSETSSIHVDFNLKSNYMDTTGAVGTEALFLREHGVASRAFDRNGSVYVWVAFASASSADAVKTQLQNTYLLYRDDGLLAAKAAAHRAGGFGYAAGSITGGYLPNVQSLGDDTYAWCGVERRRITVGAGSKAYAARAPREIVMVFDSDEARRAAALGKTLYLSGGEILQYDGTALTEVGFHTYPWHFAATNGGTGSLDAGDYTYKGTYRSANAKGEIDRSTTATVDTVTAAGSSENSITVEPLKTTHKSLVAIEVWRTAKDPTGDAPYFLASGIDPAVVTGDNRYIANDPDASAALTFVDDLVDADLTAKEANPENVGVLENLAPQAASIVVASGDRLFLAGVSDDPHQVRYSKLRNEGEVASFHDALVVQVPPHGGGVTAIAFLNETLIVFKERAVYALPGDGFDNLGGGSNYGPARVLSSDVGAVSHEAVALTPMGLVFKSMKGWYLLNRGWGCDYIGQAAAEFDADTIKGIDVVETQHQVRVLTDARMLIWDYSNRTESSPGGQWAEWSEPDGRSSTLWDGAHVYCTDAAIFTQRADFTGTAYGLDVETANLHPGGLMDYVRCRRIQILGAYKSAHRLRVRMAFDYDEDADGTPTWRVDKTITVSPATVGRLQEWVSIPGGWQKCEAIKVRITALHATDAGPPDGEALSLTAIMLDIGFKRGGYMRLPVAQRQ